MMYMNTVNKRFLMIQIIVVLFLSPDKQWIH